METINAKSKKSTKVTKANNKIGEKLATKATQKKSGKLQSVTISDGNEENVVPDKLKKHKKRLQNKDDGKTKQIDNYFKKVKNLPNIQTPTMQQKKEPLRDSPKIDTSSTPLSLTQLSFDFNSSDNILDLSDIIQGIVSNSPTITDICGIKLRYECANKQLNKPNKTVDDTADEFDIMVSGMKPFPSETNTPIASRRKTKKRSVDKRFHSKSIDSPSTTPIIIKKFFKRNCIDHKSSAMASSTPTNSAQTSPQNVSFKSICSPNENEANVSYFFGDITEENDAFEKLTDFRNMEDEICTNNEDDIVCLADASQKVCNDSPPIELSETFDLDDYVPVGANLRKRLAS